MKFYVKNKLFSLKGSSTVKDENSNDIYKVKGKFFSLTRKKKIFDMNDNLLYIVKNKFFHFFIHSTFILNSEKQKVAKVKNRFMKPGYDVVGYGDQITLDGWGVSGYSVVKNGEKVGTVRNPILTLADCYEVEIEDNEDPAFVVAMVIAIDNVNDRIRK